MIVVVVVVSALLNFFLLQLGVNFTNILRAGFSFDSVLNGFSVQAVLVIRGLSIRTFNYS